MKIGTVLHYDSRGQTGIVRLNDSGEEIVFNGKQGDMFISGDIISFDVEVITFNLAKNIKFLQYKSKEQKC
jgi:hypothetical protein